MQVTKRLETTTNIAKEVCAVTQVIGVAMVPSGEDVLSLRLADG